MANIDYDGARKEIVQIFEKAGPERKIVFWYDAPVIFKDSSILSKADELLNGIYKRSSIFDVSGRSTAKKAKQKLKSLF